MSLCRKNIYSMFKLDLGCILLKADINREQHPILRGSGELSKSLLCRLKKYQLLTYLQ